MNTHRVPGRLAAWLLVAAAALALGGAANAASLWVANSGADSGSCGAKNHPCRSISQAMDNAVDGDTIWVGAGHYGSVGGGNYDRPGDEHATAIQSDWVAGCIVCIGKALQIYSVYGASVTIIDGSSAPDNTGYGPSWATVYIARDGVTFGAPGAGFTVTGGNRYGLLVDSGYAGWQHKPVTVSGNTDLSDATGFAFYGPIERPHTNECIPHCQFTTTVRISDNTAIGNRGTGFELVVLQDVWPGSFLVRNNRTVGAGTGFAVDPGYQLTGSPGPGWWSASMVGIYHNVALAGGLGFSAILPGTMLNNTAVGNASGGFFVVPGGAVFQRNSAIANGGPGLMLNFHNLGSDASGKIVLWGIGTFNGNNFINNDRARPADLALAPYGYQPGPGARCGILTVGGWATDAGPWPYVPGTVPATGNYWGSASGPSTTGAGDAAGGACDQNLTVTVASPFLPAPSEVSALP